MNISKQAFVAVLVLVAAIAFIVGSGTDVLRQQMLNVFIAIIRA